MAFRPLLLHLAVPAVFALSGLTLGLVREGLGRDLILAHLVWGAPFYATPHLIWIGMCASVKPRPGWWHAGLGCASAALLIIGALSIWGPRDRSGLPYWWLMYWPLSLVMWCPLVVAWLVLDRVWPPIDTSSTDHRETMTGP